MNRTQRKRTLDQPNSNKGYFDGIILIDKSEGETSFDIVKRIRRVTRIPKVGHAGTLDPFATGLLVVLLGQGTKLSPYLMIGEKRYLAAIRLGIETDTLDPTGRVIRTCPVPRLGREEIEANVLSFIGSIEQVPPAFSSVHYKGKRAYKLARKGFKPELTKRTVTIFSIKVVSVNLPEIIFEIGCSHGTYIRSLALDIGKRLDSVAYLYSLRRLSSGPFQVKDALHSKLIESGLSGSRLFMKGIQLKDSLPFMDERQVDAETADKIRKGIRPKREEIMSGGILSDSLEGFIKITYGSSLIAIMEVVDSMNEENWLKKIRVFHSCSFGK